MRTRIPVLLAALTLSLALPAVSAADDEIPARPEQLKFGELRFDIPSGDSLRHTLNNGVVVYVAEDHTLPLVDLAVTFRAGSFLDPADKPGLARLTGTMIRQGGTARRTADEFDERVDFLAADLDSSAGDTEATASFNCISPVLDETLDLFFEMLRTPRFQVDRLEVEKSNVLEEMKQRNDDAGDILRRQWGWLLYGEAFHATRQMTRADLDAIGRDDLANFHARAWRPENMIVSVAGDIDTEAILAQLEKQLGKWEGSLSSTPGGKTPWPPEQPTHKPVPGLYHVEKDIPQGKVYIGDLTRQWNWDDIDEPAVRVMHHILGGSGFTSRITKRVRSDEGLAYSAGSRFSFDRYWPGDFKISFQSKNATVALAAKLALEEVQRIRTEPVTEDELNLAKTSLIDSFPRRFESARQLTRTFAGDAYLGRPHSYWQSWRDRIRKVTAEDVRRVAEKYLPRPDEAVFLVVGKWEEIAPGDADRRATMKDFFGGEVRHLPLRDPLTLEPLP